MLPVSVIVPHLMSRKQFFLDVCLPSIMKNDPAQVLVVERLEGACEKRNEGARMAVYDYLLFVDDDAELLPGAIETMLEALRRDPGAAFAYGDTIRVSHVPPVGEFTKVACGWNPEALRRANYIDITALIRKDSFPGFDPEIRRFQDWDLWLTILERGGRGVYVRKPIHRSYKIDRGISETEDFDTNLERVKRKHGIT